MNNKNWLKALLLVAALLTLIAGPALADPSAWAPGQGHRRSPDTTVRYAWAQVISVHPVYRPERRSVSRDVCYRQPGYTTERVRYHNPDSTASTLLGAVIGGALGHTVGHGNGRTAATIAGAVIGGAIGNNTSRNDGYYSREQRYVPSREQCHMQTRWQHSERLLGYDVTYRYQGVDYRTRTPQQPGSRIRVRIQQIVSPAGE